MIAPEQDTYVDDPTRGWSMTSHGVPQLSGGACHTGPGFLPSSVAKASTAHGVPDGEPQRAGAILPGRANDASGHHPSGEDARRRLFDAELARLFPEQRA